MSDLFEINAQPRSDMGKGASRRLRRQGLVPGIVYGAHRDPEMLSLVHSDMIQHLEHEAFYSHILTLNVGDNKGQQVILKDMQRHPSKPFILHMDFQRVSADEKIRTHVPLHFINEATAVGVKMGGVVSHHLPDVEISCLPKDLPEYIEVDLAEMEIGDITLMSGLKLPEGVELTALTAGQDDLPVASIHTGHVGEEEMESEDEEIVTPSEEGGE